MRNTCGMFGAAYVYARAMKNSTTLNMAVSMAAMGMCTAVPAATYARGGYMPAAICLYATYLNSTAKGVSDRLAKATWRARPAAQHRGPPHSGRQQAANGRQEAAGRAAGGQAGGLRAASGHR